jgi:hypothetical protein
VAVSVRSSMEFRLHSQLGFLAACFVAPRRVVGPVSPHVQPRNNIHRSAFLRRSVHFLKKYHTPSARHSTTSQHNTTNFCNRRPDHLRTTVSRSGIVKIDGQSGRARGNDLNATPAVKLVSQYHKMETTMPVGLFLSHTPCLRPCSMARKMTAARGG